MEPTTKQPTAEEVSDLIRETAGFYVGSPELLGVRFQESVDGAAYFRIQGCPDDQSRLVGKGGCHVQCMSFLIEQVGKAQGNAFTFRLLESPGSLSPMYPPRDVLDYDPRPARDLLCRWLSALGVEDFTVEITSGAGARRSLFFSFDVTIKDESKARDLTAPKLFVIKRAALGEPPVTIHMSTVGALGTLYRAIAKQNGIRFQVRLADLLGSPAS